MNVTEISTEELERRLHGVTQELAEIKTQLDFAKSDAAETGNYSDPDWFNRARHAARMKGREHQLIQTELGKRKKAERRAFNTNMERYFIDAARRELEPHLFSRLWAEATANAERTIGVYMSEVKP